MLQKCNRELTFSAHASVDSSGGRQLGHLPFHGKHGGGHSGLPQRPGMTHLHQLPLQLGRRKGGCLVQRSRSTGARAQWAQEPWGAALLRPTAAARDLHTKTMVLPSHGDTSSHLFTGASDSCNNDWGQMTKAFSPFSVLSSYSLHSPPKSFLNSSIFSSCHFQITAFLLLAPLSQVSAWCDCCSASLYCQHRELTERRCC